MDISTHSQRREDRDLLLSYVESVKALAVAYAAIGTQQLYCHPALAHGQSRSLTPCEHRVKLHGVGNAASRPASNHPGGDGPNRVSVSGSYRRPIHAKNLLSSRVASISA